MGIDVVPPQENYKQASIEKSERLSMQAFIPDDIQGRKVAVLIHDQVNAETLRVIINWSLQENVIAHLLTPMLAPVKGSRGEVITSDGMQKAEPSIIYDAVIIADGDNLDTVLADGVTKHYLLEAYKHLKPVVFLGNKVDLFDQLSLTPDEGTLLQEDFRNVAEKLKQLLRHHRIWSREALMNAIPA